MDSLRGQPNPESRVRAEHIDRSSNSIVYTIYGLYLFLWYFAVDVNKNKTMKALIFFNGEILAYFEKAVQTSD